MATHPARAADSLALRLATAGVGIPLLLLLVWAGSYWFVALVALAALGGTREFYRLVAGPGPRPLILPGLAWALLMVVNGHLEGRWTLPLLLGGILALLLMALLSPRGRPRGETWSLSVAGPLYLGGTLTYAVYLRHLDQGAQWVTLALGAVFAADTAAYVAGRALGRRPLAPILSPGKTWEGALGGLLASLGATPLLALLLGLPLVPWQALLLGTGVGLVAQAGDLLESALKRACNAKEAGALIPGHGGLLDRLDSVVFSLVLVYHGAAWMVT